MVRSCVAAFVLVAGTSAAIAGSDLTRPVTPEAMPEAVALLELLRSVSGHYTLTGQHNPPNVGARNSEFAARYTGRAPAVWTSDFGFSADGDLDSYLARPKVVAEAIRQHRQGSIVSLCWHAVPPTADEPVTFQPAPGADPAHLHSVQGRLTDAQFRDVLTPGTALHARWTAQVDAIAGFLKQLQDAHVPVLWRPYHEMNGDWFWWGARADGDATTAALYRQIFDRLVKHHGLKNLIWEWSVDRVQSPAMAHERFFPGIEYVDVLVLDVYHDDFAPAYYDSLVSLAQGKPLALAEVGNPPAPAVLGRQPLWTYYATWTGMVRNLPKREYAARWRDTRYLSRDDAAYATATQAYRQACGLPALVPVDRTPDFSGSWVLDEDRSQIAPLGASFAAARLDVTERDGRLQVRTTRVNEFADDDVSEISLPLDGSAVQTAAMTMAVTVSARRDGDRLQLTRVLAMPWAADGGGYKIEETWTLELLGDRLVVQSVAPALLGKGTQEQRFVYQRR